MPITLVPILWTIGTYAVGHIIGFIHGKHAAKAAAKAAKLAGQQESST
jgi:hypothetical protein